MYASVRTSRVTAGWIRENDDVAGLIEGAPNVSNGEVLAQA
jgi:hypothetical protein